VSLSGELKRFVVEPRGGVDSSGAKGISNLPDSAGLAGASGQFIERNVFCGVHRREEERCEEAAGVEPLSRKRQMTVEVSATL
jgi:hypothetical protein